MEPFILFLNVRNIALHIGRSLRDLQGESGASLCEAMLAELKQCAWEVYGVPSNKLRIFFHYHVMKTDS